MAVENSNNLICIVEDEAIIRKSLEIILKKKGYEVKAVKNAELALKIMMSHSPSLFIIDRDLPGMKGYTLAQNVINTLPQAKIIFVTGYVDLDETERMTHHNICCHLSKPVNLDRLLSHINMALNWPV